MFSTHLGHLGIWLCICVNLEALEVLKHLLRTESNLVGSWHTHKCFQYLFALLELMLLVPSFHLTEETLQNVKWTYYSFWKSWCDILQWLPRSFAGLAGRGFHSLDSQILGWSGYKSPALSPCCHGQA